MTKKRIIVGNLRNHNVREVLAVVEGGCLCLPLAIAEWGAGNDIQAGDLLSLVMRASQSEDSVGLLGRRRGRYVEWAPFYSDFPELERVST